jgi:hypothetical protein
MLLALLLALSQDPPASGKFRGEIKDPATQEVIMKVRMRIPEKRVEGLPWGLIFVCHGFQGHENNSYLDGTVAALQRQGLADQYLVIAGKSKGEGWTSDDDPRVLRLFAWARERYPVDPRRVFLLGSSNGAKFVGRFGQENQDTIAGVVLYCGSHAFPNLAASDDPAENRTEWYFVHGGKDRPEASRRGCEELRRKGYRYVFRQLDGYGHTDIWDGKGHPDLGVVDAVRDDWALWIHSLRHKSMPLPDSDHKALEALPVTMEEATRIGGPAAAAAVVVALGHADDKTRAAAARTAGSTRFGHAVVKALVGALDDPVESVRKEAAASVSRLAGWRVLEAQQALQKRARDKDLPPAARARACRALGEALRLAFHGNFEDKAAFWTLVLALDDPEGVVRAAALEALKPAAADGLGFDPEGPADARSAAAAKWRDWCRERCGAAEDVLK